jgi:hypothetical protein
VSTFQPYFEILPQDQQAIWPWLSPSRELGLVLYGGTAIALRLGHRTSIDFDFFTEKPLDIDQLNRSLPLLGEATILQSQPNTLSVWSGLPIAGVKLSFFGNISFGRVGVPETTEDGILEVASLIDLLATKLKVIQQRIEAKDYRDIAAILRSGVKLEDGLSAAAELFGVGIQPSETVKALTYFEGGDLKALPESDKIQLSVAASSLYRIPITGLASKSLSIGR